MSKRALHAIIAADACSAGPPAVGVAPGEDGAAVAEAGATVAEAGAAEPEGDLAQKPAVHVRTRVDYFLFHPEPL